MSRLRNSPAQQSIKWVHRRGLLVGAAAACVAGMLSHGAGSVRAADAAGPPLQGRIKPFIYLDPPTPAPLEPFLNNQGQAKNILAFYGEVVLLNFWATWCAPCVWELPHLDRLQARFPGQRFRVVAVSQDVEGAAKVAPFYRRLGIENLEIYIDPDERLIRSFGWIHGLPITYLIDRKARIIGYMDGPAEWHSPAGQSLIRHFLTLG